jgi:hypothetical protein
MKEMLKVYFLLLVLILIMMFLSKLNNDDINRTPCEEQRIERAVERCPDTNYRNEINNLQ